MRQYTIHGYAKSNIISAGIFHQPGKTAAVRLIVAALKAFSLTLYRRPQ
jgi:hypothetical protein